MLTAFPKRVFLSLTPVKSEIFKEKVSYLDPRCSKTKNLEWRLKEVTLKKGEKFRESINIYLQNVCVPDAKNCVNSRELGLFMRIQSRQIPEH